MTDPAEPATEAGRRLLERESLNSRSFALIRVEDILAIERESLQRRNQPLTEPGLDAAWAEAEAALSEGWTLFGVTRPGMEGHWWASAHGPIVKGRCDMGREHEDYPRENGYGDTPAAALLALAARLSDEGAEG